MREYFWLFCLAISFAISTISAQDENAEEGMKPVAPQVLWKALPGNLDEWVMLRSTGEMGLGSWLESKAVREFKRKDPPVLEGQPKPLPAPTMWTRILVTDTGKHPEPLSQFRDFSTETPSGDDRIEKIKIQSWPTITKTYEDGLIVANMMVAERFVVEFVLKEQPKRNLRFWARQMDFSILTGVRDSDVISLPPEVLMVKLDQLKPKRNKGYLMGTTSEAELEAELTAEEEELREVMGYVPEVEDEDEDEDEEDGLQ